MSEESTRARGDRGEALAEQFLRERGLVVVARKVLLAGAEVDLVATEESADPPIRIFVEVRTRASTQCGHPIETIDRRKRAQVIRAAKTWLLTEDLWDRVAVRFDVVTISGGEIEWWQDAFREGE